LSPRPARVETDGPGLATTREGPWITDQDELYFEAGRVDFGLYSHQSRPWLNTLAAWLTRLETQLGAAGALAL